jgi:hypothetical protein
MGDKTVLHAENTFGKLPEPLIHDPNITDGAARQYAHMHWRAGQSELSWEGQPKMANIFGLSRQTIANRINELAANDWLVVVARGGLNPKTGHYQTNVYHVFELQSSCRAFRKMYVPSEGETVLEKPAPTERKSRKGKGGNPKLGKPDATHDHVNSSLQGDHVNSSLHAPVNSGLHSLDSGDLDSSSMPNGADKPSKPVSPQIAMQNAIHAAFGYVKETTTGSTWSLIGKAAKELLTAGATPDDIIGLHRHCAARFDNFKAMALVTNWEEYQKTKQPRPSTQPSHNPAPASFPPVPALTSDQLAARKAQGMAVRKQLAIGGNHDSK